MDRLCYNETLAICALIHLLGDFSEITTAHLDLMAILCVDGAIRKRLPKYNTYHDFVIHESSFYNALNRKFIAFQPIILNAMTMMLITGVVQTMNEECIMLTDRGKKMGQNTAMIDSEAVREILLAANHLYRLVCEISACQLYKDLKIRL